MQARTTSFDQTRDRMHLNKVLSHNQYQLRTFEANLERCPYPSFINDSPSIMVLNFLLAPSSFRRATTATGSVALRRPPSNNDVFQLQLYGKISYSLLLLNSNLQQIYHMQKSRSWQTFKADPRKKVEMRTPGPASSNICTIHLCSVKLCSTNHI